MKKEVLIFTILILLELILSSNSLKATEDSNETNVTKLDIESFSIILEKKVFSLNEEAIIEYTSDVKNLTVTAKITLPDKTTKDITLPIFYKLEQIGLYEIEASASAEGYKQKGTKIKFKVIEAESSLNNITEEQNITTEEDTEKNLTQQPVIQKEEKQSKLWIYLIIGIVVIVFLIIFLLKRKKGKELSITEEEAKNIIKDI